MLDPSFFKQAAPAAALVTQMAIASLGGAWLGATLDERFATAPWLFLTGVTVGATTGFYLMFRGFQRLEQRDDDPPADPP